MNDIATRQLSSIHAHVLRFAPAAAADLAFNRLHWLGRPYQLFVKTARRDRLRARRNKSLQRSRSIRCATSSCYPATDYAALIASDDPSLTPRLLDAVPDNVGVVFKVARAGDGDAIASRFAVRQTAEFWSFTSEASFVRDAGVHLTRAPDDTALDLFAAQGHARSWLEPLLDTGSAFACIVGPIAQPCAVCFAFENYRHIREIGGVVTPPEHRSRGFASRVVRTALAELASQDLTPRYQVDRNNQPSIRLAESVGLQRFLAITHFLHLPLADKSPARAQ